MKYKNLNVWCGYCGENDMHYVVLNGEKVFQSKDASERDMFYAVLIAKIILLDWGEK